MCDEVLSLNVLLAADNVPEGETMTSMEADFLALICWTEGWLKAPTLDVDSNHMKIQVDFENCPFKTAGSGRRLAEGDVEFSIIAGNIAMNALEKELDDDDSDINTAGAEFMPTLVGPDATAEVGVKKDIEKPGLGLMGVIVLAVAVLLVVIICCCVCCCRYVCKCCCVPKKNEKGGAGGVEMTNADEEGL